MKKLLTESAKNVKEAEEERRMQLNETFRTADFPDLVELTHPKVSLGIQLTVICCAFSWITYAFMIRFRVSGFEDGHKTETCSGY
jgi:hypothetical protein